MPTYLALFRGINVSGKKIIKMEELRRHMESAGYLNAKTYIQSGNVIFESSVKSKEKLSKAIEALIQKEYSFDVTVFVIDLKNLIAAVDNSPFVSDREREGSGSKKLYVTFLSEKPSPEKMELLQQATTGEDLIEVVDDVLYFKLNTKASESKLSNTLIESKLKLRATTRNWNTTLKLLYMLEA